MAVYACVLAATCAGAQVQEAGSDRQMPQLVRDEIIMADGYRLPLATWQPDTEPCRVVLAVHGFNDFHLAFEALGPALAGDCVAVYAHDQRGFGATERRGMWAGADRLVDDVIAIAALLRERYPELPLYLIGESMGAAVIMLALARDEPPEAAGAVLLAPAVWGRATQPWYMRAALWLAVRIMPGARFSGEVLRVRASDMPEVLRYWRDHPMVIRRTRVDALDGVTSLMDEALAAAGRLRGAMLILYGGNDEIVPPEAVCTMLRALPDPDEIAAWRFVFYPGGYHLLTRDSRASETLNDIAAWLESPRAALPSGLELDRARAEDALCH